MKTQTMIARLTTHQAACDAAFLDYAKSVAADAAANGTPEYAAAAARGMAEAAAVARRSAAAAARG